MAQLQLSGKYYMSKEWVLKIYFSICNDSGVIYRYYVVAV